MLKTPLCDALGIETPIILAPMGVLTSPAMLATAVSDNGGLGSIATLFRPCPFRKFYPAVIGSIGQNHRIFVSDVCSPSWARTVRRRPVQVAPSA